MIGEYIEHLLTKAATPVKKLGFVAEAIAINARQKRCKSHWQSHLDNSKNAILNEIKKLPRGAHIVVLGAGSLHDFPLYAPEVLNKKITLVDIIFLPKTKKRLRPYQNIQMLECDITGYSEVFYNWTLNPSQNLPAVPKSPRLEKHFVEKADLVISLNIASQLPIQFEHWVEKLKPSFKFKIISDALGKQHLNWLEKQNCPSLILTDIKRMAFNNDQLVEETIYEFPSLLPPPINTWDWDIAPKGEVEQNIHIKHLVGCWLQGG